MYDYAQNLHKTTDYLAVCILLFAYPDGLCMQKLHIKKSRVGYSLLSLCQHPSTSGTEDDRMVNGWKQSERAERVRPDHSVSVRKVTDRT